MAPKKKRKALRGDFIPSGAFLLDIPHITQTTHASNAAMQETDNTDAATRLAAGTAGQIPLVASSEHSSGSSLVLRDATSASCSTVRVHPNPDQRGGHHHAVSPLPASIHTVSIQAADTKAAGQAADEAVQQRSLVLGQEEQHTDHDAFKEGAECLFRGST